MITRKCIQISAAVLMIFLAVGCQKTEQDEIAEEVKASVENQESSENQEQQKQLKSGFSCELVTHYSSNYFTLADELFGTVISPTGVLDSYMECKYPAAVNGGNCCSPQTVYLDINGSPGYSYFPLAFEFWGTGPSTYSYLSDGKLTPAEQQAFISRVESYAQSQVVIPCQSGWMNPVAYRFEWSPSVAPAGDVAIMVVVDYAPTCLSMWP
ncbi:hypothetical protein KFE98_13075 [bacterium SCSIO 12741]|nr:hypothetical protein KFE98_13075 [bacterium SCSIO 12741]